MSRDISPPCEWMNGDIPAHLKRGKKDKKVASPLMYKSMAISPLNKKM